MNLRGIPYGSCTIEQSYEGISIEYYDENGTKWKTELDWWDCAAYVESMIADGVLKSLIHGQTAQKGKSVWITDTALT